MRKDALGQVITPDTVLVSPQGGLYTLESNELKLFRKAYGSRPVNRIPFGAHDEPQNAAGYISVGHINSLPITLLRAAEIVRNDYASECSECGGTALVKCACEVQS